MELAQALLTRTGGMMKKPDGDLHRLLRQTYWNELCGVKKRASVGDNLPSLTRLAVFTRSRNYS